VIIDRDHTDSVMGNEAIAGQTKFKTDLKPIPKLSEQNRNGVDD
jgi:hypothetical protein